MMIENKNKLILALDFPDFASAKKIIEEVESEVNFFKIGLEMLMSADYFKMIEFLKLKNKKVFADLKLYDIPQTVANAVRNLARYEIDLLTIHTANFEIMNAAAQNKGAMKVVGVTILTSLEQNDLYKMGFDASLSLEELVLKKAALALKSGLDGVVASALEAKNLRQNLGDNFLIVTPGIRIESAQDDQKRTADVKTALGNGASYLVVGRPIAKSGDPLETAKKINKMIEEFNK